METKQLLKIITATLVDKKANNIVSLETKSLSYLCDYMVLADTSNTTHVKSLVFDLEHRLKKFGILPKNIDKDTNFNWVVLDYGNIIVNIFHEKTRQFYQLEKMWQVDKNKTT